MSPSKALTCHKCSRGYISKDTQRHRGPILLECGHSLCEECIRAASKEPLLTCPQCQQLCCVNATDLQHDAYLNGCLVLKIKPTFTPESLSFVHQKKPKKGPEKTLPKPQPLLPTPIPENEKCEECGIKRGTLLCAKCEDCRFCEPCFSKVHRTSKTLSRHVARAAPITSAMGVSGDGDGGAACDPSAPRCCPLHAGRPLEYFCLDDEVAVCSHCSISGEHKGHTVEPVSDRNARRRTELEQAMDRARNTLLRLRMAAKGLRDAPALDVLDPAALLETIQQHFAQLHGQLQLRQRQLSSQLLTAVQAQRAHLVQLGGRVDESQESARQLLAEAEAGLAGADATLDLDHLLARLAQVSDRPCHLVWTSADKRHCEAKFLADKALLKSIGDHGKLELDLPPPVQLLAESELPLDHVVKDITPEMLAEADAVSVVSGSSGSSSRPSAAAAAAAHVPGAASATSAVEVVGVARAAPRLLTSPRPPDSRLAAVFPGQARPLLAGGTQDIRRQQQQRMPRRTDDAPGRLVVTYPKDTIKLGPYGQELVVVTHINKPSNFYVQRANKDRSLQELMRRIQIHCKSPTAQQAAQTALLCSKNEPCLSQYSRDSMWYRARIIDIYMPVEEGAQPEYEVFYVDFGNQERVYRSRLQPMTRQLAQQPEMALPCALWDLIPADGATWSPQATQTFAELVRGEPVLMTTVRETGGRREVELLKPACRSIASDSPQSVKDHLVFIGLARYVAGPAPRPEPAVVPSRGRGAPADVSAISVEHVSAGGDTRRFYAAERFQRGQSASVLVSHVESPHLFYVQQMGVHSEYLSTMMDDIQRVYTSKAATGLTLLNPRKGQVCMAQYSNDGRFYRAEIEALLPQAIVDVLYVDYGNKERISVADVRKIEDKFMVIPQQAIQCRLADIKPAEPHRGWEDEVRQKFVEEVDNVTLKMYVESLSEAGEHSVTLYKCSPEADICLNALLAQLPGVDGSAPSLRVVEYKKVGYDPVSRGVRATPPASSSGGSAASDRRRMAPPHHRLPHSPSRSHTAGSSSAGTVTEGATVATAPSTSGGAAPLLVVVSFCQSPAAFYVQTSKELDLLNSMMHEMQIEYGAGGAGASRAGYVWKEGDTAVARCTAERVFYRVTVMQTKEGEDENVEVYLVDYGRIESVKQSDILTMLPRFAEHRAFAMRCHLQGIRPAGDSGIWTGFAIDFLKSMIAKSKVLILVTKMKPSEVAGPLTSLPCDLEVEEEKVVGALEPIRRIRTSLAGKLVEQGLAFNDTRGGVSRAVVAAPAPEPRSPPRAAGGASSSAAGGAAERPPAESPAYLDLEPAFVECWADDVEDALTLCADEAERAGETAQEAAEVEQEIPLGGDWSTLSSRHQAAASARVTTPTPAGAVPAVAADAAALGDLERTMLEQEQAAEAVEEQQQPDDDWLPARVPAETHLRAVPTHVTMAGSIYLHTFPRGKETLDVIQQALLTKYKDSQPRPCDAYWHEGQPCIAKYFLDQNWYRAKVLQVHSEKVSVQFVDYGNTDRVEPCDLRKNIFMEHVPIQSLHCELYNVAPLAEDGCYPVKTLNFLHQQIVERQCDVEVHHFNAARRRFLISLKLVHSGMDVNELLIKMGEARYMTEAELAAAAGGAEPLMDTLLLRAPFPRLRLPSAAPPVPVLCIAVLSPSLALLQPQLVAGPTPAQLRRLTEQLDAVGGVQPRLDECAGAQPPLPRCAVGEPCLSRFSADDAWYRAVVLSVAGDRARVMYIDWGNIDEVPVDSLREVPADLLDVPAWTLLVELYRITPPDASGWKPDAQKAMEECLFDPNVQLWAKVKQSQREPPLVEVVVYDDLDSPTATARLAYQRLIDDGLVTLCTARRPTVAGGSAAQ